MIMFDVNLPGFFMENAQLQDEIIVQNDKDLYSKSCILRW